MKNTQPNILFIQLDQLAAHALQVYGNTIVKTPYIDSLAEQGVVFENAYCNFPLCAPSRFSMLSGQLCSKIGAYDNAAEFPASIPTFVHYLRAMGYQTSLVGKMHYVGPDQLHGFEERLTTDIYPSDYIWTGDWSIDRPPYAADMRALTDAGICTRSVQMDYDDVVCHRAQQKIYDQARSADDRPFFSTVSMTHPHDPYLCAQEYWDRYRHDDIELPTVTRPADSEQDAHSLRLLHQCGLTEFEATDKQIRNARHGYYGAISYADDKVGEILKVLDANGLRDNAVIILTSDHGEFLGERGLWFKRSFFEPASRIPLIISAPERFSQCRVQQNVSLIDLFPTLLELASDNQTPQLVQEVEGSSLCGLMQGDDVAWSDTVYGEILSEGVVTPLFMIRKRQYKYVYSKADEPQLFDIENDPHELNNLCGQHEFEQIEKEFLHQVTTKWDSDTLSAQIVHSQKTRLFLQKALSIGKHTSWDYDDTDGVAAHCYRGDGSYNDWAYSAIK
ncbi:MAG: choline-sulfatase [Gammaproteobacteria bacterium]|nr:choline-sulfatase [Gammaproteobacteria bacterium]